jgi:hypothetical protein
MKPCKTPGSVFKTLERADSHSAKKLKQVTNINMASVNIFFYSVVQKEVKRYIYQLLVLYGCNKHIPICSLFLLFLNLYMKIIIVFIYTIPVHNTVHIVETFLSCYCNCTYQMYTVLYTVQLVCEVFRYFIVYAI